MRRSLSSVILSLLTVSALAGCPAAGPSSLGGPSGATVDSVNEKAPDVVAEATDKPHPGGVTALPAEHGDEYGYLAEGQVEPSCRLSSGKIQYRFHGSISRKLKGADGEYVLIDSCSTDLMTVRFWNGQVCDSREIQIQDCKFNGFIASEQMEIYNLYSGTVHLVSITPEMGPVSQTDDSSDSPSSVPTMIDSSKLSNPIFKDLVDFHPACKVENVLPVDNQLVNSALPENLPACSFNLQVPNGKLNGVLR
jgi:hypothetical protein